jgi:hypothetical protein
VAAGSAIAAGTASTAAVGGAAVGGTGLVAGGAAGLAGAASTVVPGTAAGGIFGSGISVGAASTAATGLGTGLQVYGQMKAQSAMREQQALQQDRQTTQTIRESRIAYANAENSAANQGVSSSSSAQGGQGSIVSQMGNNLTFLDKYASTSKKGTDGLMFAGFGQQLASTGASIFANQNRVSKIFGIS